MRVIFYIIKLNVLVLLRKEARKTPADIPMNTAGMTFLYSPLLALISLKVAGKEALYTDADEK